MITDENQTRPVQTSSVKNDDDKLAMHSQEAEQLRHRIAELLAQVEALREATKSKDALEDLVLRLREANQHLVIATVGAQDMQASAEAANQRQEEFLTMLAHELRNPLAPIAMAAQFCFRRLSRVLSKPASHSSTNVISS